MHFCVAHYRPLECSESSAAVLPAPAFKNCWTGLMNAFARPSLDCSRRHVMPSVMLADLLADLSRQEAIVRD